MSKTSFFTLVATVLLGILLYTLVQLARDLNTGDISEEVATTSNAISAPDSPASAAAIDNPITLSLNEKLIDLKLDATKLINGYRDWLRARGFPPHDPLMVSSGALPNETAASESTDADLLERSAAGDAEASTMLGGRLAFTDPIAALRAYRLAAEQGSTYALLRSASILQSLDAVAPGKTSMNPEYLQALLEVAADSPRRNLRLLAFAHLVTALRDGGTPTFNQDALDWVDAFNADLTDEDRLAACARSDSLWLQIARGRMALDRPAVTTEPPPVFISARDFQKREPCKNTPNPVVPAVITENCKIYPLENTGDDSYDLFVCDP